MQEVQYLPYRLGSVCQHDISKSSAPFVDIVCNNNSNTYHRVAQVGKICNKCSTLIMNAVKKVDYCPCCSDELEILTKEDWICKHSNRGIQQIEIKCTNNPNEIHQIQFQQKVCKSCYDKIRAAFTFASSCAVCENKENQIFQNIQKTITKPSYYYFEQIVTEMKKKNFSVNDAKNQIQHYCLAEGCPNIQSEFKKQAQSVGENPAQFHKSKRYQLYPKCSKHRNDLISLCNSCLVSILNINFCPYGCPYENKQNKVAKSQQKISESGFLCLYPKATKEYQYLEYFNIRNIEENNKFDKWEGGLKKIKYSGNDSLTDLFTLYAGATQIGKLSYFFSGGVQGKTRPQFKTVGNSFIINISENHKNFSIEKIAAMSQPRSSHGVAFHSNYVYAVGGLFNNSCLNTCQKYNLNEKRWQKMANLNVQRSKPNLVVHKNVLYAFGGISSNDKIWNTTCERYNQNKDIWENIQYRGYDIPFTTAASALSQCWGLPQTQNLLFIGGSNYESSTNLINQVNFQQNSFKMQPTDSFQQLNFKRASAALTTLSGDTGKQRTIIIFGGLQEHEPLMSVDAIRFRVDKNEISPFFIYDEISLGSYRMLLRENRQISYEYMVERLIDQGFLTKQKIEGSDLLKSDANSHLIQKMWYGLGKCIVGFSSF